MKRFRRSRDDGRFALTTLQNPTLEVRSRPELIAAAEKNVAEEEACPPRRDAAPVSDVPSEQNSARSSRIAPHRNRTRRNTRNNNAHQEKTHSQSAWRSALNRRVKWNFATSWAKTSLLRSLPIRDAATRARLAKHFAEERAKASLAAATESPASPEIIAPDETLTAPIPYVPNAISPDFSRHSRRCTVCAHPHRDAIEADFVRWRSPNTIANMYGLVDRAALYRHAHATGLFARRKRETCRVLEYILECVETCPSNHARHSHSSHPRLRPHGRPRPLVRTAQNAIRNLRPASR